MAKPNDSSAGSSDKGLMDKNVTAPSTPPDETPREKEQPHGLENQNLTQPADIKTGRQP